MLILASRSPRRQELLRAAGIEFRVVPPEVEDVVPSGRRRRCAEVVRRAALEKALQVARGACEPVLAADTIVVCEGEVMGKPRDEAEARRMLRKLSGRRHHVYTGVALVEGRSFGSAQDKRCLLGWERTEVTFRRLSRAQVDRYVATGEPMDKAGAYAIQGEGAALVQSVRGCYTNVIGLPVPKVMVMLEQFGQGAAGLVG